MTVTLKKPTQCILWNKTGLLPTDLNMQLMKVFKRGTHIERDLLKCRECGQLYFHDWYEHVSFSHDADMYDTYIPVETDNQVDELSKIENSADFTKYVPQLHGSFTNGHNDELRWIQDPQE
jgi:hypothetical protein